MGEERSILSELTSQIGRESPPRSEEVEKGAIRRFVNSLSDHNPLYEDEEYAKKSRYRGKIAPPLFSITFNRQRRPQPDSRLGKGAMNAGNEFEFFYPIRSGDVITSTTKLVDVKERMGRLGRMLIVTRENTFVNQRGERVAIGRWTTITHEGRSRRTA